MYTVNIEEGDGMNPKRMFSVDLLHQVEDPVLIFKGNRIVFANIAAVKLFRYESDMEMYGLNISHLTSSYEKKSTIH